MKKLTEEQKSKRRQEFIQQLEQGMSIGDMAAHFGIGFETMKGRMREVGLSIRQFKNRPIPSELIRDWTIEEILSLKAKNYSAQAIGDAYGKTRKYIESMLSEKKVTKKFAEKKFLYNQHRKKEVRQRELDRQKELMLMGYNSNQIAADIGISVSTINHRCTVLGLSFRAIRKMRDSIEIPFDRIKNRTYGEIISLVEDGYTEGCIANAYQVNEETIRKFINQGYVSDQFTNRSHPDHTDDLSDLEMELEARFDLL